MLTEDLVIYHVRDHLVANGWEIVSLAILNNVAPMRSQSMPESGWNSR